MSILKISMLNVDISSQLVVVLSEEGSEIFDNLSELEQSISLETKMSLVYTAGYVTRKDKELYENELLAHTNLSMRNLVILLFH